MAMPTLPLIVLVLCHTTCILQAQAELEEVESDMDSLEKELQQGCSSAHHARERLNRLEKKLARQEKLNFTGGMVETYMFKFMAERFRGLKLSSRMDMKPGGGSRLRHAMNFPAELMEGVQAREAEQKLVCIYIHSPCLFHDADNSSVLNDDVLGAFLQSGSVAGLSRPVEIQFWHDMVLDASNATCVFWQPGASKCGRGRDRGNANSLPPRGHRLSASRAVLAALDVPSMSPSPGCCATLRRQLSGRRGQRGQLEQVRLRDHAHGGHRHLPLQPPHLLRRPAGPGGHPDPGPAGIAHPHQHHRLLPLGCCRPLHPPALLLLQAAAEGHHDQDPHAPPGHAAPAQLQLPAELAAGRRRRGALPHRRRPAARQPSLRPGVDGRRSLPPPPPPRQGLPTLAVVAVFVFKRDTYGYHAVRTSAGYRNATMCWLTSPPVHYATLCYAGLILLFNMLVLARVVAILWSIRRQRGQARRDWVTVLGLTCLLGTTWGLAFSSFGVFLVPQLYLFTILNSLQGLLVCLWYVTVHHRTKPGSISNTSR
ncbi:adhesion G-protein coupled receptor G5-like isoform X3 [Opisthocomus hoazin]|uniref:adhesion G-protein coupled receptor G5-like isoform X3 n=1 Tax=Opisthocomus hoazin TaxID=30419 RepID=UPI003F538ED9